MKKNPTRLASATIGEKLDSSDRFRIAVIELAATWKITVAGAQKYLRETGNDYDIVGNKSFLRPAETRRAMLARGVKFPKKTICLQMLKGGVGKTTTALNLGLRASMYGAKILLIDLDQQANLSFACGFDDENQKVWADVLEGKCSAKNLELISKPFSPPARW